MAHGFGATFECPKCPYVAVSEAQLTHHMVTNPIHGREERGPRPEGRGRPKTAVQQKKGNFR